MPHSPIPVIPNIMLGFSAPKGVERACPMTTIWKTTEDFSFQCPEGR